MPSVLFYSPFAGIPEHELPEQALQNEFRRKGWSVKVIRCDGYLKIFCPTMAARGLQPDSSSISKELVCRNCRAIRKRLTFQGDGSYLAEAFLSDIDIKQSANYGYHIDLDRWMESEFDGMPLARYAAYEFLISRKLHDPRVPEELQDEFRQYIYNVAVTSRVARSALQDLLPDRVITYNTLYGVNRVWKHLSEEMGIPCYSIHGGPNVAKLHNTLMSYRDDNEHLLLAQNDTIREHLSHPISARAVSRVGDTLVAQLEATSVWVYSKPHEKLHPSQIRSRLGIDATQKVVLAALPSADERFSALVSGISALKQEPIVFANQVSWLMALSDYCTKRPDVAIIVRLHPRMYPNKREGQTAASLTSLLHAVRNRPVNMIINTPTDEISLSDLLQITDAGALSTSSVGLQMLAYGIPVVVTDPHLLFAYPSWLGIPVSDEFAYGRALDQALDGGWSIKNSIGAFRWLNYLDVEISRDVKWRTEPEMTSGGASVSSKRIMPPITQSLMTSAPRFLRVLARNSVNRSVLERGTPIARGEQEPLADIETVVKNELPGLQSLFVCEEGASSLDEFAEVKRTLARIGRILGVHKDEPNSLASRLVALDSSPVDMPE